MNKTIDEQILEQILPYIIDKLGVRPDDVTLCADLQNDLGADSLDTVEMMSKFQIEFKCTFPDGQQEVIRTIGDVIRVVKETSTLEWIRNGHTQSTATVAKPAAEPEQKHVVKKRKYDSISTI